GSLLAAGRIVGNAGGASARPRRYRIDTRRICAISVRAPGGPAGVGLGAAAGSYALGFENRRRDRRRWHGDRRIYNRRWRNHPYRLPWARRRRPRRKNRRMRPTGEDQTRSVERNTLHPAGGIVENAEVAGS